MVLEGVTYFNDSCSKGQNDTGHMSHHLADAAKHMHQAVQHQKKGCQSLDQVEHGFKTMLRTVQGRADSCGTHRH